MTMNFDTVEFNCNINYVVIHSIKFCDSCNYRDCINHNTNDVIKHEITAAIILHLISVTCFQSTDRDNVVSNL